MKPPRWRRLLVWAALVIAAVVVVFMRRWIHHARLESVPVIVPADMPATEVAQPPAGAVLREMLLEAQDALHPKLRPRLAVLTFDDGPFPVTTPVLLAQLRALGVPAVFFLIGRDTAQQPAIALRAKRAGIELGNHSDTHPEMTSLRAAAQMQEIASGAREIAAVTGEHPLFFRPPHGNFDAATVEASRALGETMVLWDVDPGDWRSVSADEIAANVVRYARSPAVIALHNGRQATVEALPRIVRAYRDAGFEFVTLSQLEQRLPLDAINDPMRITIKM